jgi:hypothetical protein
MLNYCYSLALQGETYPSTTLSTTAGMAILANKYLKNRIHSYTWHNERFLTIRFKIDKGYLSTIAVYRR